MRDRVTGRRPESEFAAFGERVLLLATGVRREKAWSFGIWPPALTHDAYIGTPEGVVRARTIKRTGEQDRRARDEALAIRGTTLKPERGAPML